MKTERIVLSVVAVLIGLFVAGIAFYFFQMAQKKPAPAKQEISILPSPTPEIELQGLSVTTPEDEAVLTEKSVEVSGKAKDARVVIISTEEGQTAVQPDAEGNFKDTITLSTGVNLIHVTAYQPTGKEISKTISVSYSTESF